MGTASRKLPEVEVPFHLLGMEMQLVVVSPCGVAVDPVPQTLEEEVPWLDAWAVVHGVLQLLQAMPLEVSLLPTAMVAAWPRESALRLAMQVAAWLDVSEEAQRLALPAEVAVEQLRPVEAA